MNMTTNRITILTSTILLGLTLGLTVGACGSPQTPEAAAAAAAAAAPKVAVPSGTAITIRLDQSLSTDQNKSGDTFGAILDEPVVAGGAEVIPKGTRFTGHVTTADTSGRLEGRGVLGITLDSFELNGRTYPVVTSLDTRTTEAHKKGNIELIGGGAGVGALIGAIAGGGKGAAIGAGVGAAGGTGIAAATGEKNVHVAAGTPFKFSLTGPIEI
jgi:hypothetical protein